MKKILKGTFNIIDYNISHKLLLLRSTEIVNEEVFNVDIIFEFVFYLEIPNYFEDLVIEEASCHEKEYVYNKCFFHIDTKYEKVYKLITSNKTYYVGCWGYKITNNSLMPLKSSIIDC